MGSKVCELERKSILCQIFVTRYNQYFVQISRFLSSNVLPTHLLNLVYSHFRYNHLFDGMALMHQFRIDAGIITYMSKFLHSDAYRINSEHNRIMVSEFGTVAMPDPCKSIFERFTSRFNILGRCQIYPFNLSLKPWKVKLNVYFK